jgi:hypothetical protein
MVAHGALGHLTLVDWMPLYFLQTKLENRKMEWKNKSFIFKYQEKEEDLYNF